MIRKGAPDEVRRVLAPVAPGFVAKGSTGRGTHWAAVPWLAVFDPSITTSATRGFYLVHLFPAHRQEAYFCLVQGTVAAMREYGPDAEAFLRRSGDALRERMSDFFDRLPLRAIDLGTVGPLPDGYAAAHILGLAYDLDALGDERRLHRDLAIGIEAYRALKARGGLDLG